MSGLDVNQMHIALKPLLQRKGQVNSNDIMGALGTYLDPQTIRMGDHVHRCITSGGFAEDEARLMCLAVVEVLFKLRYPQNYSLEKRCSTPGCWNPCHYQSTPSRGFNLRGNPKYKEISRYAVLGIPTNRK